MTPDAMHNSLQGWWQTYARTLTDTADYELWLPRETILDQFATLVHSLASHETQWNWQTHRCPRYEVNPHGLTRERVRAVLSVWWHTHGVALREAAADMWSLAHEPLIADLVTRIRHIEHAETASLPEEQHARQSPGREELPPLLSFRMGLQAPPMLEEALGYLGSRRWVSFCSTPTQQLRCYDGKSGIGSWRAWQAFHAHRYVHSYLAYASLYLWGLEERAPLWHCLLLDRQHRLLEVREILDAELWVGAENPAVYHPPLPPHLDMITRDETARLSALTRWLDDHTRQVAR